MAFTHLIAACAGTPVVEFQDMTDTDTYDNTHCALCGAWERSVAVP